MAESQTQNTEESKNLGAQSPQPAPVEQKVQPASQVVPVTTSSNKLSSISASMLVIVTMVIGLVAFTGGMYLGETGALSIFGSPTEVGKPAAIKKGSFEDGYESGLDFARKKLSDSGVIGSGAVNYLSNAKVLSASGDQIIVEVDAVQLDFFAEGKVQKTLHLTESSQMKKRTPKSPRQYEKESLEYRESFDRLLAQSSDTDLSNLEPPLPYTEEDLKTADLKAGDLLNISFDGNMGKGEVLTPSFVEHLVELDPSELEIIDDLPPADTPDPVDEVLEPVLEPESETEGVDSDDEVLQDDGDTDLVETDASELSVDNEEVAPTEVVEVEEVEVEEVEEVENEEVADGEGLSDEELAPDSEDPIVSEPVEEVQ